MPFVEAKCTNCGATLVVDSAKDAAICEFCGSAFIVEKAINNYNITNHNHITANVVNVYNTATADYVIRAGRLLEYRGSSVNAVIPKGVTVIGERAFAEFDKLKSVTIPDGVEAIEWDAFFECKSLTKIFIPDSVKYIAHGAFYGCEKLRDVVYVHFEENAEGFKGTPFYTRWQGMRWEEEGKCGWCGGYISRFSHKCKVCGRNYFDYDMSNI